MSKKATVYSKQIAPLIRQIFEICKDNDIPFIAAAMVDDDRVGAIEEGASHTMYGSYIPEQDPWAVSKSIKEFQKMLGIKHEDKDASSIN